MIIFTSSAQNMLRKSELNKGWQWVLVYAFFARGLYDDDDKKWFMLPECLSISMLHLSNHVTNVDYFLMCRLNSDFFSNASFVCGSDFKITKVHFEHDSFL
jgi:hypothetical protein